MQFVLVVSIAGDYFVFKGKKKKQFKNDLQMALSAKNIQENSKKTAMID